MKTISPEKNLQKLTGVLKRYNQNLNRALRRMNQLQGRLEESVKENKPQKLIRSIQFDILQTHETCVELQGKIPWAEGMISKLKISIRHAAERKGYEENTRVGPGDARLKGEQRELVHRPFSILSTETS